MDAAVVEIDGCLVQVGLDAGEQCRRVLDGIVGLEIGGLECHKPIAVGMALVECVVGEGLDDVEPLFTQLDAVPLGVTASHELLALKGDHLADLLATRLAQVVGLGQ